MSFNDTVLDSVVAWINQFLPKLPVLFVVFCLGFVAIRVITWVVGFLLSFARLPKGFKGIIVSLVHGAGWILLVVASLQILGFQNILIFLSSSIVAFGIIMAAGGSTLFADISAGIFLAQDRDFRVGDEVITGDPAVHGTVESMDARRTRLRDRKGQLHVIPNSVIERKEWILLSRNNKQK